jgi:hypothetical protein
LSARFSENIRLPEYGHETWPSDLTEKKMRNFVSYRTFVLALNELKRCFLSMNDFIAFLSTLD